MSVEEALARRRSLRELAPRPLTRGEISQLLWATQGVTGADGDRAAPSAGATFPLEIYVATAEAVFRYRSQGHLLATHRAGDRRRAIYDAAVEQEFLLQAPATFVFTGVFGRSSRRYGPEDAPRYVHLETGHAAQNLLLQAVALGLGAVAVGAFYEDELLRALALPRAHRPVYLVSVGESRPR